MERNLNATIFVIGKVGTGKSTACIRIAQLVAHANGTEFDVENNICFDPKKFLELVESLPPGTPIIYEEAGTSFGSRESMTKANVYFGKLLQTIRYKRLVAIFNVPTFGFVDLQARMLTDFLLVTEQIIRSRRLCKLKCYSIHYGLDDMRMYKKFLDYTHPRYGRIKLEYLYLKKPHQLLLNTYESHKDKYIKSMVGDMLMHYDPAERERLQRESEEKEKLEKERLREYEKSVKDWEKNQLNKLETEVYNLYGVKGVVKDEIARALDMTPAQVQSVRRNIEKKMDVIVKCGSMESSRLEKHKTKPVLDSDEKKQ